MNSNDRRQFLKALAAVSTTAMTAGCANQSISATNQPIKAFPPGQKSVVGLTTQLATVRVGFIGVGERGYGHVQHFCHLEGVEIKAICDIDQTVVDRALAYIAQQNIELPAQYSQGDLAYRDMLNRSDIDIVIISTPWRWHTPMAVDTMESGKHAFVEVPAATSIEECWQLVNTAERTQKNCMMMENVCYGRDELMVLNMVRNGLFGELLHGEAAYIHELRWQMKELTQKTGSWRTYWHTKANGNLYPTHGLGPVSQYMNINRGDRFDYLTSTSSPALGRAAYAKREFASDHERNQLRYIAGDMNTTVIKTKLGRTIMVQHDTTTPRPYSRHNYIQGTNGAFSGFPNRIAVEHVPAPIKQFYQQAFEQQHREWLLNGQKGPAPSSYSYHHWDANMAPWQAQYDHPLWVRMGKEAERNGGHGGMDFLMLWRMVYCLRNGEALDQDVYDAAAWSAIMPLSIASVSERSNSQTIPDFTRGNWQHTKPLAIVK